MSEIVEQFDARSEAGKVYRLIVTQSRINTTSLGSRSRESMGGLPEIKTADGLRVNAKGPGTFQLVKTGEILTRI